MQERQTFWDAPWPGHRPCDRKDRNRLVRQGANMKFGIYYSYWEQEWSVMSGDFDDVETKLGDLLHVFQAVGAASTVSSGALRFHEYW
jgi:hypothetical protein